MIIFFILEDASNSIENKKIQQNNYCEFEFNSKSRTIYIFLNKNTFPSVMTL